MTDNTERFFQLGEELMSVRDSLGNITGAQEALDKMMPAAIAAHRWIHENSEVIPVEHRDFIIEAVCQSVAAIAVSAQITGMLGDSLGDYAKRLAREVGIEPGANPSRLGDDAGA